MFATCYKLPVISWQLFYKLHLFQQKGVMIYNCPLKIDAGSQSRMCTCEELLVRDYYFTPWTAAFFMPRHLHCVLSVVRSYNESSSLFSLSISSGGYLYIKILCEQFCTCLLQGCSDKDSWDGWQSREAAPADYDANQPTSRSRRGNVCCMFLLDILSSAVICIC